MVNATVPLNYYVCFLISIYTFSMKEIMRQKIMVTLMFEKIYAKKAPFNAFLFNEHLAQHVEQFAAQFTIKENYYYYLFTNQTI